MAKIRRHDAQQLSLPGEPHRTGTPITGDHVLRGMSDIGALAQLASPTWPNRNYIEGAVATIQRKDRWREAAEHNIKPQACGPTTRLGDE